MAKFGETSRERGASLDPRWHTILDMAIKIFDFAIICGHRNKEDQNKAHETKRSKLRWPKSKHNSKPSKAVDIAPWDQSIKNVDWFNHKRFIWLAGIIQGIAHTKDIKIRWGGDFNMDTYIQDENFLDMAHFELVD